MLLTKCLTRVERRKGHGQGDGIRMVVAKSQRVVRMKKMVMKCVFLIFETSRIELEVQVHHDIWHFIGERDKCGVEFKRWGQLKQ